MSFSSALILLCVHLVGTCPCQMQKFQLKCRMCLIRQPIETQINITEMTSLSFVLIDLEIQRCARFADLSTSSSDGGLQGLATAAALGMFEHKKILRNQPLFMQVSVVLVLALFDSRDHLQKWFSDSRGLIFDKKYSLRASSTSTVNLPFLSVPFNNSLFLGTSYCLFVLLSFQETCFLMRQYAQYNNRQNTHE